MTGLLSRVQAKWVVVTAVSAFLGFSLGCMDKPSPKECRQLLEHIVTLELEQTSQDGDDTAAQRDKQAADVLAYAETQFLEQCTRKTPRDVVRCGLAAKSRDAVAACDTK